MRSWPSLEAQPGKGQPPLFAICPNCGETDPKMVLRLSNIGCLSCGQEYNTATDMHWCEVGPCGSPECMGSRAFNRSFWGTEITRSLNDPNYRKDVFW